MPSKGFPGPEFSFSLAYFKQYIFMKSVSFCKYHWPKFWRKLVHFCVFKWFLKERRPLQWAHPCIFFHVINGKNSFINEMFSFSLFLMCSLLYVISYSLIFKYSQFLILSFEFLTKSACMSPFQSRNYHRKRFDF